MNGSLAVYPGSFDPVTNGHLDILRRALTVVDHVVLAVAYNQEKPSGLFSVQERIDILAQVTEEFGDKVTADSFHGLLVDYARRKNAGTIIRGLQVHSFGGDISAFVPDYVAKRLAEKLDK